MQENMAALSLKLTSGDMSTIASLSGTAAMLAEENESFYEIQPVRKLDQKKLSEVFGDGNQYKSKMGDVDFEGEEYPDMGDYDYEDAFDMPTLDQLKEMGQMYTLGERGKTVVSREANLDDDILFLPVDFEGMAGKLVAMEAQTGGVLWEFFIHGHFGAAVVPSVDRRTIYFSTEDLHVYALKSTNGDVVWDFHGNYSFLAQPALGMNGLLYVGDMNGVFYAIDVKTGKLRWTRRLGQEGIWSTAAVGLENARRVVYVATLDTNQPNVFALDAELGEILWQTQVQGAVTSALVLSHELRGLYVGAAGIPGSHNATVSAFDTITHTLEWSHTVGPAADLAPGVARCRDKLLVAHESGRLAVIIEDGEVEYSKELPVRLLSAPLVLDQDQSIVTTANGTVYAFRVSITYNLSELGQIGASIWGSGAKNVHGMVFLASVDGTVVAMESSDASRKWQRQVDGFVAVTPAYL